MSPHETPRPQKKTSERPCLRGPVTSLNDLPRFLLLSRNEAREPSEQPCDRPGSVPPQPPIQAPHAGYFSNGGLSGSKRPRSRKTWGVFPRFKKRAAGDCPRGHECVEQEALEGRANDPRHPTPSQVAQWVPVSVLGITDCCHHYRGLRSSLRIRTKVKKRGSPSPPPCRRIHPF